MSTKERTGVYLLDLSKLIFGGVIIAGIMKQDVNASLLFFTGFSVALITALVGITLTKPKN